MIMLLFVFMISLLLIHEMDAIRTKEWRMFIILKDLPDETAYKIYLLAHLPLYYIAFYVMVHGNVFANYILCCVVDVFLLFHTIIHYGFKKKPNNGFTSTFSKTIIYFLGVLAIIHLCLLLLV